MRFIALALGSGLASFSFSGTAHAQLGPDSPLGPERPYRVESPVSASRGRGEEPQPSAWERLGQRGIEVQVRGGVVLPDSSSPVLAPSLYPSSITGDPTGDILAGRESPYGPDPFGITLALGYRFFPWLSAGAVFSYAKFMAKDGTDTGDYKDGTSRLERQLWSLGAYGRYYLASLHPRLHPWVELGFAYSQDNASYIHASTQTTSGTPEAQQYLLEEEGLMVPLTVGLDWRVAPAISFGPSIGYARVVPLSGCVTDNVDSLSAVRGISNQCSSPVSAHGYGVFFGGIFAKVTFDVFRSAP
jgi:hypothetical protein